MRKSGRLIAHGAINWRLGIKFIRMMSKPIGLITPNSAQAYIESRVVGIPKNGEMNWVYKFLSCTLQANNPCET